MYCPLNFCHHFADSKIYDCGPAGWSKQLTFCELAGWLWLTSFQGEGWIGRCKFQEPDSARLTCFSSCKIICLDFPRNQELVCSFIRKHQSVVNATCAYRPCRNWILEGRIWGFRSFVKRTGYWVTISLRNECCCVTISPRSGDWMWTDGVWDLTGTWKCGSVGQSEGLSISRFRLKPENSKSHGFKLHRLSIKSTELLFKVIIAIIIIIMNLKCLV